MVRFANALEKSVTWILTPPRDRVNPWVQSLFSMNIKDQSGCVYVCIKLKAEVKLSSA
jgi:hypothetical protein